MNILGINEGHNSSAALLVDGRVVAAISEERFTRRKNEYGYPSRAVMTCLELGGINVAQIDRVALATRELPPKYFMTQRNASFTVRDYWREQVQYWYPRIYRGENPLYLDVFRDKIGDNDSRYDKSLIRHEDDTEGMLNARIRNLQDSLGVRNNQIAVYDHHSCHAYYGYLANPNPADTALIFTADGSGDGANGSIWKATLGKPLVELMRTDQCNIGRMYRYATLLLGMKQNEHEYKVMGLAPYANEHVGHEAYEIYAETLQVDGLDFKYKFRPKDHFFYFKERLEGLRFDGIAHAIQRRTEELLTEWINNGIQATGVSNIVFSGGVAQNIKANKKIWELDSVSSLFVPPASGDESLSIGAAYQVWMGHLAKEGRVIDRACSLETMYHGTDYTDKQIDGYINQFNIGPSCVVRQVECDEIAGLLVQGHAVARFCGRMEFGPRALGNRSILADPRRPDVVKHINDMIKKRDFWMPFTPSILAERANDYFINPKDVNALYMTVGFDSTLLARSDLVAALHPYDSTVRPQIVTRDSNLEYHDLLLAFQERTGVGALLNTSFNLHGEPIVESPSDALSTFQRSGLRYLVMGKWLVSKVLPINNFSI